ncbi:MAG: SulP family inorganic anion transporter [Clostridiales bacterium]|jgi:SulP family sulfate permease|nr:SulP family inorganic anion transporter [Clostridiales bacterium]
MKPELLSSLAHYNKKSLFSDMFAGLIVALVALPLSVALGLQSEMTLQAGLVSAIIGGFFIASLGGARFSIGGPSATFLVVIVGYVHQEGIGLTGTHMIIMLAGVILVVAGLCRAGKLLRFVPYPIVIGFTAGIGVILLCGQLKDLLGLVPASNPPELIPKLIAYVRATSTLNPAAMLIGFFTLWLIFFLPKISKKIPTYLVALVAAGLLTAGLNALFGADSPNTILTIGGKYGEIKPEIRIIDFSAFGSLTWSALVMPAFLVALLSALEGLLSATVADGMSNLIHDPNMELIGHGIANLGTGLAGGLPVTGVIARTSVNIESGAKTSMAGVFHALFVLVMFLALMPVIRFIPFAALAAILVKVAIAMSKFPLFAKFLTFGIRDAVVLAATFLLTVLWGVAQGVLIGLALAFAVNIQNFLPARRLRVEPVTLDKVGGGAKFARREGYALLQVRGAVFFISINKLVHAVIDAARQYDEVIVDMEHSTRIDATSVERLAKRAKILAREGKHLVLHNLSPRHAARYRRAFEHIIIKW